MNFHFTKKAYEDYLNLPMNYKDMVDRTLEKLVSGIPIDIKPIKGEKILFALGLVNTGYCLLKSVLIF